MIICVAGNPSIDKLFVVDRLRPGEIHRPVDFVQVPGGKGLNVSRAATTLGADVRVAAVLCGHAGRWIESALGDHGVSGWFVWGSGETRSSLSVADRENNNLTEFYEDGSPLTEPTWQGLEAAVRGLLNEATWLTLSGSVPPGAPDHGYGRIIRTARDAGIPSALDARGKALAMGIAAGPDVVKLNAAEAAELLGRPTDSEADSLAAARELRRLAGLKGRAGVVTRGPDGVVLAAPDGSEWSGRLDVWGPYSVGCGDVFLAGVISALDHGAEWPEPLSLGLGAAAANAEVPGAGYLDRARAEVLAEQAEITRIG
jgi:1-phosphofructokinase family hexose kinase